MVRATRWQSEFLARPLASRRAEAEAMRERSRENGRTKAPEITDVSQRAVEDAMHRHGVDLLIHGHTHRPKIHDLTVDGRPAQRIVLADWYETGGMLRVTPQGMALVEVRRGIGNLEWENPPDLPPLPSHFPLHLIRRAGFQLRTFSFTTCTPPSAPPSSVRPSDASFP
jgi:hypothetical protein